MPFEKSKKISKSLFIRRLVGILEDRDLSFRSFSAQIGVSHASLSRFISGGIAISPKMVARVCKTLDDKAEAAELMKAFLTDQLQEINRALPKNTPWAQEPIVTVAVRLPGK
jgi:transcriptional regulator with XRE-family HTH domain